MKVIRYNPHMSETAFAVVLDRDTINRINLLGEYVRQAVVAVLGEPPERIPLAQFDPTLHAPEDHQAVDVEMEQTPFGTLATITSVQFQLSDLASDTEYLVSRLGGIEKASSMMHTTEPQAISQLVALTALQMLTVATMKPVLGNRQDTSELRKAVRDIALSNWQNRTAPST